MSYIKFCSSTDISIPHIRANVVICITLLASNAELLAAIPTLQLSAQQIEAIRTAFPQIRQWREPWPNVWSEEYEHARGALIGSKREFEALLVNFKDDENFPWQGVVVLTRVSTSENKTSYRVIAKSRLWPHSLHNPEPDVHGAWQVDIQYGYLFISSIDTKGCCLQSNSTFQFAFRRNKIVLVGHVEELYTITPELRSIRDHEKIAGCSINYKTKKKLSWRRKNNVYHEKWSDVRLRHLATLDHFVLRETPQPWPNFRGKYFCNDDYSTP